MLDRARYPSNKMDNLGTPVYRKAAKEHNNHKVVRKRRSGTSRMCIQPYALLG
jgi:hypothetical protein